MGFGQCRSLPLLAEPTRPLIAPSKHEPQLQIVPRVRLDSDSRLTIEERLNDELIVKRNRGARQAGLKPSLFGPSQRIVRRRTATSAAALLERQRHAEASRLPYLSGFDLLASADFSYLRQRRYALLTNATGVDSQLRRNLDLLVEADVAPELILEPEHGLFGHYDRAGPDGLRREGRHQLRVLSLYSSRRRIPPQHLRGLDLIVIDIASLGVRTYTYYSTIRYLLEDAEHAGIEVVLLDRPEPYRNLPITGGYLLDSHRSFVGEAPTPFLFGLTPGEFALYMAEYYLPHLTLTVFTYDDLAMAERVGGTVGTPIRTGTASTTSNASFRNYAWINPSPNIPNRESALVYPGVVKFEGTNISLGRGTTRPFVYSGAPWLNNETIVEELRQLNLPDVAFNAVLFTPSDSLYRNQTCHGVQINPLGPNFDPVRVGYEYMRLIQRHHPRRFTIHRFYAGQLFTDRLWGGPQWREAILADLSWEEFATSWREEAEEFTRRAAALRLYP